MSEPMPETEFSKKVMSFWDHLTELRKRLFRIAVALVLICIFTWEYRYEVFSFLSNPILGPLADHGIYQLQVISLTESIMVYMKSTFIAGTVILSPYIFWELWSFIGPGLYAKEKKLVLPLSFFSALLFFAGAVFAYAVLLPFLTQWLVGLSQESEMIDVVVTLQNTYHFSLSFMLMFGLVFQLPLVLFFLTLWGVVSGKGLFKFWRYFVLFSVIISGILTPPDPVSQVMMAVPLNILYGVSVLVALAVNKAEEKGKDAIASYAVKVLFGVLAGFALLALGGFWLLKGLPERPLYTYLPKDSAFVMGANPKVLALEPEFQAWLEAETKNGGPLQELERAGYRLENTSHALWIGKNNGERALLLREKGLREALPGVDALDKETLVLGDKGLKELIKSGADAGFQALSDEDRRLFEQLTKGGPLWLWMPENSETAKAFWAEDHLGLFGSSAFLLTLSPKRRGTFYFLDNLNDKGQEEEDALGLKPPPLELTLLRQDAWLSALASFEKLSLHEGRGEERKMLLLLAEEISRLGDEAAKERLRWVFDELQDKARESSDIPLFFALSRSMGGFSTRKDLQRVNVTTELGGSFYEPFFKLLGSPF